MAAEHFCIVDAGFSSDDFMPISRHEIGVKERLPFGRGRSRVGQGKWLVYSSDNIMTIYQVALFNIIDVRGAYDCHRFRVQVFRKLLVECR